MISRKLLSTSLRNESGSISILITSLFLLVFTLSVGIIDISDSYLAKRELIAIGEDAILVAAHSLDESLYYSDLQSLRSITGRVPIDCAAAASKFQVEIFQRRLRGLEIAVSGWQCSSDQITASISSKITALINFPILSKLNSGAIGIDAIIGATSELANGA